MKEILLIVILNGLWGVFIRYGLKGGKGGIYFYCVLGSVIEIISINS